MKTKWSQKLSSFILCMALTVAMALSMNGCGGKQENTSSVEEKAFARFCLTNTEMFRPQMA